MDERDKQTWRRVATEYHAAYSLARKCWPEDTPPEVIQSATATLLIHHGKVAGSGPAPRVVVNAPAPAPAATPKGDKCPKCNGAMWDNRATKKGNQPDFKCKDKSCAGAVWVESKFPKKSNPVRAAAEKEFGPLDEVPGPLEDDSDSLPF